MKNNNTTCTCTCTSTKLCYSCFAESFNNNLNKNIEEYKQPQLNENITIYDKICVCCNNAFKTNSHNKLTCSIECSKNRKKEQRTEFYQRKREREKNNI